MDPSSSVEKTCLGENVIEISSDKAEGHGDLNSLEYQGTTNSRGKKETKDMIFHKMDTDEISNRFVAPCFVNGLEAYDGEINLGVEENMISNEFEVKLCLEHEVKRRNKVVNKELIVVLRGEIYFVKTRTVTIYPKLDLFLDSAKEKEKIGDDCDPLLDDLDFGDILDIEGVDVPKPLTQEEAEREALAISICKRYSLLEEERPRGSTKCKERNHDVEPLKGKAYGAYERCSVPSGCNHHHRKFLILDMPIDRDTPILVGRGFLHTCGGILNTIDSITSTFNGICHQTFRAAKTSLDTAESDNDDEEEYAFHQDPNALDNTKPWRKYCSYKFIMNFWNGKVAIEMRSQEIDGMLRIDLREAKTNKEIFTSMVWSRAFNINEPIYSELCHEFFAAYEFDEVCTNDELKTKKIIKFRLSGRAHSLTLLEFAYRLGLYHVEELDEEGFDVYFQGGLRSDEHFNAQEYWLREENLSLYRSHAFSIRNLVLRVLHKMITYGLCQSTTRDLDTTTLRELIDSKGRHIPKAPEPDVPRVAIPRPQRASIQDLYDRMGSMKIHQGAIERMAYRQSYL
ncbi:hypothetical protein Tco_0676791 [Tanacetum coccineum]